MVKKAVHYKFYDSLKKQQYKNEHPKMTDIVSCNLHIVHSSFKIEIESTDWEVKKFLKSSYQILHDSLAHRPDYISITNSTKFPLSFCSSRQTEDKPVGYRLLETWPHIVKVVNYWASLLKLNLPQCNSFDLSTLLKLSFFSYYGSQFQLFLTKYQDEKLLILYLYEDLSIMVK